jgi:hypothetical protein
MMGNQGDAGQAAEFRPDRPPVHGTFAPGQSTDVPDVHYALSLSPSTDARRERYWAKVFAYLRIQPPDAGPVQGE